MKCPKCKTDGAYQPLLRKLECMNVTCSSFVMPPKVLTKKPKENVHYAIHSLPMKSGFNSFPVFDGTKPEYQEGHNPCNEITLPDPGHFKREYDAQWDNPAPQKDKYPLDSFEITDVMTERNHYSKRVQMRVTLVGNFHSEKDMADARVALYEILRKRTRKEIEKLEGEMSHGYGVLNIKKRIVLGEF